MLLRERVQFICTSGANPSPTIITPGSHGSGLAGQPKGGIINGAFMTGWVLAFPVTHLSMHSSGPLGIIPGCGFSPPQKTCETCNLHPAYVQFVHWFWCQWSLWRIFFAPQAGNCPSFVPLLKLVQDSVVPQSAFQSILHQDDQAFAGLISAVKDPHPTAPLPATGLRVCDFLIEEGF